MHVYFVCIIFCLHLCLHNICVPDACGGQKSALGSLELGVLVGVSCPMWVLGIEPRSSAKAAHILHG